MNDGQGGSVMTEIDSIQIRDKPWLSYHSTSTPNILGATYIFQLEAYNVNGNTFSDSIGFVFGSTPDAPTDAPGSDLSVSSQNQLRITY
jgi:hypothetical protein